MSRNLAETIARFQVWFYIIASSVIIIACNNNEKDKTFPSSKAECKQDFPPLCSVQCSSPGESSGNSNSCCTCYQIGTSCGAVWQCAYPSENKTNCLSTIPAQGAKCSLEQRGLACDYCNDGFPVTMICFDTWSLESADGISCVTP
jgi:hypothetical protein